MKPLHLLVLCVPALASCAMSNGGGTLAQLRDVEIEIKEETIEGGLEKAMASYQHFLEETPESGMTPEAIRRLADLKVEREYGYVQGSSDMEAPARENVAAAQQASEVADAGRKASRADATPATQESEREFEERATATGPIASSATTSEAELPDGMDDDLERAGALEAIELYKQLLAKYPLYQRNDQVLYQMSRAYEELGRVEDAMEVMNRIVKEYPRSRYMDEVQFRRAEYFFTRSRFLDAEDAYQAIVGIGVSSSYYELALHKLGWVFYKQDLYEAALHKFIAGLDYKVSVGYDFEQTENKTEKKRIDDTFRVISLSFSNLGGPDMVTDYFARFGERSYEDGVYSHLGEYYLAKRRYSDAASAYKAFVELNPLHRKSPHFHMRVTEIYKEGGFPKLVVEAKKEFARVYGLNAEYWQHYKLANQPKVVGYLKTNLKDLANHYHALYQDKRFAKEKPANYSEALLWYREFLSSFPKDEESPAINYQLADLLLENESYGDAAREYERTAYDYPEHEKASEAGYAAVYAYRQHLKAVPQAQRGRVKRDAVRSSLRFVDIFPRHEKASVVLGAAADDLYEMKDFEGAVAAGRKLIADYPQADQPVLRSAWIAVAHASFDLNHYVDAEEAYTAVLRLTKGEDKSHSGFVDNLAASIYKQGEQANTLEEYRTAANHFLRIAVAAPTSKIRPTAEYEASVALITLEDWTAAGDVLVDFRKRYPEHELQPEVTNKLAYVYKEGGQLSLAAAEYERVETESDDEEVRRGALMMAAELYEEAGDMGRTLQVYQRYVEYFPRPVELALETRFKIATIHKDNSDNDRYLAELETIVETDAAAGEQRTDRTRYLAATSALVLAEPLYSRFSEIKITQPIEKNLKAKQEAMKAARDRFAGLIEYQVGETTAAATFYMAEIYYDFARALIESERPEKLSALEREQYELAIEDQAYPFEDKAISVHEKNIELMSIGIYNQWIDKSIQKLATLVPVRYAKFEETTGFMQQLAAFSYAVPRDAPEAGETAQAAEEAPVDAQEEGDS
ncbi:tetratricopeptide repeat protein [Thiohalomonas denitrificans]|uniref:tetratricopeptide repeat protein n=1 Tax=Thiohalomonas denitrificans TaxID=415747 RepID=UPI0026EA2941|nr:tetratricopeptide repeat protein [Thiohalomonas denitrificans]